LRFLLDTHIVSGLVRDPHGPIARRIAEAGERRVCTSVIVAAELRSVPSSGAHGAARGGARRLGRAAARAAGRSPLRRAARPTGEAGQLIGPNDLLIAAQALALDCTVVTDNEREFSRVEGLRVENWLRR
jgi:tRNA(fMet)-specific endonuclease VapC